MKFENTASGSQKITMSKSEWLHIGKQAGWRDYEYEDEPRFVRSSHNMSCSDGMCGAEDCSRCHPGRSDSGEEQDTNPGELIAEGKCPECGGKLDVSFEPSYQEYPGASVHPSYTNYECPACGWSDSVKGGSIEGQENRRGF